MYSKLLSLLQAYIFLFKLFHKLFSDINVTKQCNLGLTHELPTMYFGRTDRQTDGIY